MAGMGRKPPVFELRPQTAPSLDLPFEYLRTGLQRKASSAQVRRLTATGQERLLERVLIPAPTSSYAYRGEPTYLCKRCIFYLAACRAVSEVSSHKDRCALRW